MLWIGTRLGRMKSDFKKAAAKIGKSLGKFSTWIALMGAVNLSFGAAAGVTYYNSPEAQTAYETCISQKQPCTPEQLTLAEQRIANERNFISQLMMGSLLMTIGFGRYTDDRNREKVREMEGKISTVTMEKWDLIGKNAEEAMRANEAEQKLAAAEAQLAPYLADEKRKTDAAGDAAARQQLNQMAQDATTLQGEMKPAKKITIKPQTPPAGA